MELGAIEIFALVVAVFAGAKLIVILVKPRSWMNFAKTVWKNPMITMIVSLILAAVVLYYLLQELTIIHIFAVMLFLMLLAAVSMAAYSAEMFAMADKLLKNKAVVKKAWLSILVWAILVLWALKELFL